MEGEVFVHMAGGTLLFFSYAGLEPPSHATNDLAAVYMKRGFEMPEVSASERAIQNKAQTVEIMDQSFHLARDLASSRLSTFVSHAREDCQSAFRSRGILQ